MRLSHPRMVLNPRRRPARDQSWAVKVKLIVRANTDSKPRYGNGWAFSTAASIERRPASSNGQLPLTLAWMTCPPGIWVIETWQRWPNGTESGRVHWAETFCWIAAAYLAVKSLLVPPCPGDGVAGPLAAVLLDEAPCARARASAT